MAQIKCSDTGRAVEGFKSCWQRQIKNGVVAGATVRFRREMCRRCALARVGLERVRNGPSVGQFRGKVAVMAPFNCTYRVVSNAMMGSSATTRASTAAPTVGFQRRI